MARLAAKHEVGCDWLTVLRVNAVPVIHVRPVLGRNTGNWQVRSCDGGFDSPWSVEITIEKSLDVTIESSPANQPPRVEATVGEYRVGPGHPLLVIAGPCVLEPGPVAMQIASCLAKLARELPIQLVFKASFDKANRTSLESSRGPGLVDGLEQLRQIRDATGLPVTTDIHDTTQAAPAAEVCSLLQIPAFLARQTDLLKAAAATRRAVNVKKGQFMAPRDMIHVRHKLNQSGCRNVLLCERGTFFGYGQLVNDMRGLVEMRAIGAPVVFDATHSVQYPSGADGKTGGNRQMVTPLARAAAAVGIDGLFFETHPDPDKSPSDGANMVPLSDAKVLIQQILAIRDSLKPFETFATAHG